MSLPVGYGYCQHEQNFFRSICRRRQRVGSEDCQSGLLRQALMDSLLGPLGLAYQ